MTRNRALRRFVALLLALAALAVAAPAALADDGAGDSGTTETSPPDAQPGETPPSDETPAGQEPGAGGSEAGSGEPRADEAGSSDGPAQQPANDSSGDSSGGTGGEPSNETTAPAGDDAAAGDEGPADDAGGSGDAECPSTGEEGEEGEEGECPPAETEPDAAEDVEADEADAVAPKSPQPAPVSAPPAHAAPTAPQQSVVLVVASAPQATRTLQGAAVSATDSAPSIGRGAGAPLPAAYEVGVIPSLLAPAKSRRPVQGSVHSIVVASSTQTFQLPVAGSAIALWYNAGRAPGGRPAAVLADAEARAAKRHAGGPERRTDAKPRPREQVMPSWGSDSAFGRGSGTREKTATAHHRQLAVPVGFRPLATPRETRWVSAPVARPHSASPLSPLERPG